MSQLISSSGITGSDGVVPVYEPNARWTIWQLSEIYLGQQGAQRYVPKVNDYVIDTDTAEVRQVTSIDPSTLIPTMRVVQLISTGTFTDTDILLGVGPGTQSDTYRVYIDQSVMPHTLAVDARLHVGGTNVVSAKIFRGSELAGTAEVVSAFYDQSGTLLGQAIPLELVVMGGNQNVALKTVPVCYTTFDLVDGEVVTVVFYSDAGHVVSKRQLLVENTAFIRSTDTSIKYITGISLESPFLSHSDPMLIQYPLNVPLRGLSLMGVVQYSDGTKLRMPVDGTKFSIFGFEGFVSTIIGQKFPLVLKYSLSADEVVYGATAGSDKFITAEYRATTSKADGAYTVKLFGYPVWVDEVNGYRMEWFMYNLDRQAVYRVTPYVLFDANTRMFDPTAYGVRQHLAVSLNLKDVNGSFNTYTHVQTIDVVLAAPGTQRKTNWTIGFNPGQTPPFGENNYAATVFTNQNLSTVRISMGETVLASWLDRIYYRTIPLTDSSREIKAPEPNFFAFVLGTQSVEFPISQWNTEMTLTQSLPDSGTLFIKFFLRTPDNDIQLAVAGIPVYQQN